MIASPIARRRSHLRALDAAGLGISGLGAGFAVRQASAETAAIEFGLIAVLLFLFAAAGAWRLAGRPGSLRAAVLRVVVLGATAALLWGAQDAVRLPARWEARGASFALLALAIVPLGAALYLWTLRRGWLDLRVLLIGSGPLAARIAEGVRAHRSLGLRFVGHLSAAPPEPGAEGALRPWLGPVEHLEKVLGEFAIERIVLVADPDEVAPAEEALVTARLGGIAVESGADCYEWLFERLPLEASRRQLFLEGPGFLPQRRFDVAKRAMDVVVSIAGLVATAPLIAVAALAIRAESAGSPFFGQVRIGRGGRPFLLRKLRSMRVGAEEQGPALSDQGDPRVTRVGRVLRRTHIDELPQLWNVLRGEMSLVGPRPERPEYYDELAHRFPMFRLRLAVRPGLTGWAQVQQGYVSDWDGFGVKLSYDLFYLKRRSFLLDAKVIWRTAGELLRLKGI